jgi:hypothetical protein
MSHLYVPVFACNHLETLEKKIFKEQEKNAFFSSSYSTTAFFLFSYTLKTVLSSDRSHLNRVSTSIFYM